MMESEFSREDTLLWLQHLDIFSDVPEAELAVLLEGMAWGYLNKHLDQNAVRSLLHETKAHVRAILEGTRAGVAVDARKPRARRRSST